MPNHSMAFTAATTCVTLPPTPKPLRPRLSLNGSSRNILPFPNTGVFPRGIISAKVGEPRVFVPVARVLGRFGWRQQAKQSDINHEGQISYEELYKVMKILVSVLSFLYVDGDPNKGVIEERCESIMEYVSYYNDDELPPEEYAPHLARLVQKYADMRARQRRARELEEFSSRGGVVRRLVSLIVGPCWSFLKWVAVFLGRGVVYFFFFYFFLIYRRSATPEPSAPEFCFGRDIISALMNLLEKLRTSSSA